MNIHERAEAVQLRWREYPAERYARCRTGWDLGEAFAGDVETWHALGRDVGPLIASYRARRAELEPR
ncbi:hypothetical protein ACFWGN_04320 [Oerskovia sp. NPDC060338]|uniref:hypothetical protein n=1 Tax=Oerskovia sp. NPDC060338 TaxID=3347100 RepID=UPI003648FFCA